MLKKIRHGLPSVLLASKLEHKIIKRESGKELKYTILFLPIPYNIIKEPGKINNIVLYRVE